MNEIEKRKVIKDIIFERTIGGTHAFKVLRDLHYIDGYDKELVLECWNELMEE